MKDQSGNENRITILEDLPNNIVINPLFNNLEDCSNNINKNSFIIKLQSVLEKIKKERKDKSKFDVINKRKILLDALIENIDLNYTQQPSRRLSFYVPPKIKVKETTLVKIKEKTKVDIKRTIENVSDLLKLIEDFPLKDTIEYNIDMKSINNIKEPLENLNNMIGMEKLKNNIVNQIIYFIQKLHLTENTKNGDFMHTVIYGPPGTGKTEIAKIIGKIFCGLGVLKKK